MSQLDFSAPIDDRYFEDYLPGFEQVYGPVAVTEAEVLEFGRRFDPQDMHTDPDKAARGPFGGLIASGWHTAALLMRLSIRVGILEANRSRAKPDRGMVRTQVEVLNQSGEVVMSLKAMNMLRCRGQA